MLIKNQKHVRLRTKGFKLDLENTKRVNKTIQYIINLMNVNEQKFSNTTIMCNKEVDKHEANSSVYDNKGKGKTPSMSENK